MKLGDSTPKQWETFTCKHEIFDKVNSELKSLFYYLQVINNIEAEGSYKMMVILDNLKFLKIFIERFQNYLLIC